MHDFFSCSPFSAFPAGRNRLRNNWLNRRLWSGSRCRGRTRYHWRWYCVLRRSVDEREQRCSERRQSRTNDHQHRQICQRDGSEGSVQVKAHWSSLSAGRPKPFTRLRTNATTVGTDELCGVHVFGAML